MMNGMGIELVGWGTGGVEGSGCRHTAPSAFAYLMLVV